MSSRLLPPNATRLERATADATARISDVPRPLHDLWDPDTCPAALLPWLAWTLSVDEWSSTWTETQKRAAVAAALSVQRRKGTVGAVRRALGALGFGVRITEWFQVDPPLPPYTFGVELEIAQAGASQAEVAKAMSVVRATKNLRSHLTALNQTVSSAGQAVFACVTNIGHDITVGFGDEPFLRAHTLDGSWSLDGSVVLNGLRQ